MTKRIFCALLALLLCMSLLPMPAMAAAASGTCGENLTWSLTDDGILTISGEGAMENYEFTDLIQPWRDCQENILSVVLEYGVTTIGEAAFHNCENLISVTIPGSVTIIGSCAFNGCKALTSIAIPDSTTYIGSLAFAGCNSLTEMQIPEGVTTIGQMAFSPCESLVSVTIPGSVTTISMEAFSYCSALQEITFLGNAPSIGDWAFHNVTATAYYPAGNATWTADVMQDYDGTITWVSYDPNVIASGTCGEALTWVLTKDGALTISGEGAMDDYPELESAPWVTLAEQITSICVNDGVTAIGNCAFSGLTNVTSVRIAPTVSHIGDFAFHYCVRLPEITIPDTVVTVGQDAFLFCTGLETAKLSAAMTEIPLGMFEQCCNLKNVTIGEKTTRIGDYAFLACGDMPSITVPASVREIGEGAFMSSGLKKLVFQGSAPVIGELAFAVVTAEIQYPADDASWTSDMMQDYGGTITWVGVSDKPAAPAVKVSNVASTGKIKLTWNKVEGAAKYEVYRSTDNKNWTLLKSLTGTSLTNTSAVAGKLYYYYVVAIDARGNTSDASAVVSRRCDLSQPEITLSNVASTGKVKISWKKIEGAVKYEVYRSTDNVNWARLITTTGTSVTNTSAVAGKLYYYKVRAIATNSGANSAYSAAKSIRCDLARPSISSLTIIASTGKIKIRWGAVEDAVKYELYCSTDNKSWKKLTTTTGTTINHNSAVAGTRYYYKVRAIASNSGANSAYSEVKNGYCDLARPTLTVTLNSSDKPYLTWTKSAGAVNYNVYRSTDGTTWKLLKTTTGTKLTNTSAKSGTTYYYKVRAIASVSNANSAYSAVEKVRTPAVLSIVRQPKSVAAVKGDTFTIKFEATGDGLSYRWYRKTADSFTFFYDEAISGNSYTARMTDALDGCWLFCEVTDKYGNWVETDAVSISMLPGEMTEKAIYQRMIALQSQYPEGMRWTNENYYGWNGGIFTGGYGCAGFAFILSDAAFGTLPARTIEENISIDVVRVGDILRVNNNTHSVIILEVHDDYIVIAEGNYNSSIHWGRIMSAPQVAAADYIMTRYPEA